jgi:preprotein translocase subunit YajC
MDMAYAQTTATTTAAGPSSQMAALVSFMPIILIMVLFYFLMIYPQNKERKKKEELLNNIQRGDRVLTRGGIYGTVADIKENILIVKVNENNKIEVERSYIDTVIKNT